MRRGDEVYLNVSHNGYQYTTMSLSRQEAAQVVTLLKEHFNI